MECAVYPSRISEKAILKPLDWNCCGVSACIGWRDRACCQTGLTPADVLSDAHDFLKDFEDPDGSVTLMNLNAQEAREMKARRQSLVVRGGQEDVAGNPEGGILENVPPTIVAPVPGPPDFNGASAIVARLPNIGFAPSMLTEKGFETRGSFTVRKSRAGESFYLRVYGKLNHNMRCTLRGYRNLSGDFTGNTIYTGFKKIYTGKSQVQTGHVPRGIVGEFDIMTCRWSTLDLC
eukprot:754824-Hanusia_phi.AAC.2